jgi:PEP-CTERM motif
MLRTSGMDVQLLPFLKSEILGNIRYAIILRQKTLVANGGDMKRFFWVTLVLFVLMSGSAFATSVTIRFFPNDGSGDNFQFLQQGGGIVIGIQGGTPFSFFNIEGYAPGSTLGGTTDVFFSGGFIQFGGNSSELGFSFPGTLFLSSFTLPTNGKDFTAQVEVDFSTIVTIADTGQPLDVDGGAVGKIPFHLFNGLYYAGGFTTVPEPGMLTLMGTGLLGILALARKRLSM